MPAAINAPIKKNKNLKNCSTAIWVCCVWLVISACKTTKKISKTADNQGVPPKREFRAVWVATVDNIDWPSKKTLLPSEQRDEFKAILDSHKKTGINAVLVQVRAAADAFYAKGSEPWSEWLTGKQGLAPSPAYDPLEFMVEETHQRGMEFHAWLNLNRVAHKVSKSIAPSSIGKKHPEWVLDYDGYRLFNFGLPEVRNYITEVTVNIVANYDIDGVHFDDYFYPYTAANQTLKDEAAFKKYAGRFTDKDDWRRNNVDLLIKQIADAITATKPHVKFGVSPFGVWRNQKDDATGSATQAGQTSYDNLYADTRKWLKAGWIDYMVPQIYFTRKFDKVPFENLTTWWTKNAFNRHLYIGQAAYRVGGAKEKDPQWADPTELPAQVRFIRSFQEITGSVYFSSKSLINNKLGHADSLKNDLYRFPALIPTMPWKDNVPPLIPVNVTITNTANGPMLTWTAPPPARDGDQPAYYVVYRFDEKETPNTQDPRKIMGICKKDAFIFTDKTTQANKRYLYALTAVDRLHNESEAVKLVARTEKK